MKKSQLRKLVKESIKDVLKESPPTHDAYYVTTNLCNSGPWNPGNLPGGGGAGGTTLYAHSISFGGITGVSSSPGAAPVPPQVGDIIRHQGHSRRIVTVIPQGPQQYNSPDPSDYAIPAFGGNICTVKWQCQPDGSCLKIDLSNMHPAAGGGSGIDFQIGNNINQEDPQAGEFLSEDRCNDYCTPGIISPPQPTYQCTSQLGFNPLKPLNQAGLAAYANYNPVPTHAEAVLDRFEWDVANQTLTVDGCGSFGQGSVNVSPGFLDYEIVGPMGFFASSHGNTGHAFSTTPASAGNYTATVSAPYTSNPDSYTICLKRENPDIPGLAGGKLVECDKKTKIQVPRDKTDKGPKEPTDPNIDFMVKPEDPIEDPIDAPPVDQALPEIYKMTNISKK